MRQMTLWLRHQPPAELHMDAAGWVSLADLTRLLKVTPEALQAYIKKDNKQRFSLSASGECIRAAQGHSAPGVTTQALEASWVPFEATEVFHGTNAQALEGIKKTGLILPGERTHVHCAVTPDSSVGKRTNIACLLRINSIGLPMWLSDNGVVLSGAIPYSRVEEVIWV